MIQSIDSRSSSARIRWMRRLSRGGAWLAVGLLACSSSNDPGSGESFATPPACNPLGGINCVTPWPSSIYAIDDPVSPTGRRLSVPEGALPSNSRGIAIEPTPYNLRDGFSPAAPIVMAFPDGVDATLLPGHLRFEDSLSDASTTVLLDMDTGQRVAHFAEVDLQADPVFGKHPLYIRPAARLEGSHRYAVAIRKSLTAADGSALPIPEGFAAILDDRITEHPLLERTRSRYPDIFAALEGAGIPRDDLVVAWDFTTASDESVRRDVLSARDQALELMGAVGENLTYDVSSDELDDDPLVRRVIAGRFDAPLFLTQDGAYNSATRLARDPDTGEPVFQYMYRVPFWAMIPECVYQSAEPVGIMLYGHGLLGKGNQATGGDVRDAAEAVCVVVVGTDMRGMSTPDLNAVAGLLNDLNKIGVFEQMIQGLINNIALQHIVRGPMAETLFVDDTGQSLVDPSNVVFYGLSQGHIFGSSILAYDDFITRAVVGAGGANYSMMLERSTNWPTYKVILQGAYPDPLDQVLALSLMQIFWDPTDPSGTVNSVLTGDIPGTPDKQILIHMGHADEQVPNLSTAWQARSMGISQLGPAPYDIYGVPTETGPLSNALVIWHGGVDDPPVGNIAPEDTDSHYVMRHHPAVWRQMARFYQTGEVVNECGGPCMCQEGACE